jgi:protoporphyrinogen/coproporphyrinogen III oxidase
MTSKPVAIIGAGIAGLTAANFLRRQGVPILLFEAGDKIAGMAQSYADEDGFTYDFGAHFITNRLAAAIGIGSKCRDVKYYGESVALGGRVYKYPLGLMAVPRFLRSAIASRLRPAAKQDSESAAVYFRRTYGAALADQVALPLLEAWSGAPAEELAASVGNKFSHSVAYTLYLSALSRLKGLAVSNGYCRAIPENPQVWHVYPDGGMAGVCNRLAEPVRDAFRMRSPVESVTVEQGRVTMVRAGGADFPVSAVVSTAPCTMLPKLVKGANHLKPLAAFRYRPMIFVNLRLEGRDILPDTVVWMPEGKYPFFRLTETTQSMPWLAPEGKTIITCDIGCEVNDDYWKMGEKELGALCLEKLSELYPGVTASRYLGCRVMKTPFAYPVFLQAYEQQRLEFERSTGIDNLLSIGRNGEFAHILMEDIYWSTLKKMQRLVEQLREGEFAEEEMASPRAEDREAVPTCA